MSRLAARLIAIVVLTLVVTGSQCADFCAVKACQTKVPPCHKHRNAPSIKACTLETAAVQPPKAPVPVQLDIVAVAVQTASIESPLRPVHRSPLPLPPHPDLLSSVTLRV
jgi:hypothetical protein